MSNQCLHFQYCSTCSLKELNHDKYWEIKKAPLSNWLSTIHIVQDLPMDHIRDRIDLTISNGKFGFFHLDNGGFFEIQECWQMSSELLSFFHEIKNDIPPFIKKGSVRLRVGHYKQRGLWFDLSHVDTKQCLDDQVWCQRILKKAIVEFGQKGKELIWDDQERRYKLNKEKTYRAWFSTLDARNGESVPLYSLISSFSQVGMQINKQFVAAVISVIPSQVKRATELFSGSGNFTIPLVTKEIDVTAYEQDKNAQKSILKTLQGLGNVDRHIEFNVTNLYGKTEDLDFGHSDMIIIDPPRSGLGPLSRMIVELDRIRLPDFFIYVSCSGESLNRDLEELTKRFDVLKILAVDQFPWSKQCEWVAVLSKR